MRDTMTAAAFSSAAAVVAQANAPMDGPWWQSLLVSVGAAVLGALLNWLTRPRPPAPPSAGASAGGGA